MKAKQRIHGLILGRAKSGVVKCAACGQILGYIEKEHFDYIYLHLICRCGESGYLELGTLPEETPNALADAKETSLSCPDCERRWFTGSDALRNFAFRVCCNCGIFAENRYERKRNPYQELVFTEI